MKAEGTEYGAGHRRQNKVILTAGHLSGKSASWASPWAHESIPMRMQEETKWPIHAKGGQDYPISLQVVSTYCFYIKLFIEGYFPKNKNTRFRFRNFSLFCLCITRNSQNMPPMKVVLITAASTSDDFLFEF